MKLQSNILTLCLRMLFFAGLILISASVVYGVTDVTIGWDPNSEEDLDGYGVYINKGSAGPPYDHVGDVFVDELSNPDKPRITLTDLQDGTYYIAATAFDNQGNESQLSKELAVRLSGSEVYPLDAVDSGGGGGGGG